MVIQVSCKGDCNFSSFGAKAFLFSRYLGHRFCTRCLTGGLNGLLSSTSSNFIFSRWYTRLTEYYTFRGKQAVLFINLFGKGLTQEINGDGGSI